MKRLLVFATLAALSLPLYASPKASVEIQNRSDWAIHHIYLNYSEEREWGPDQLDQDDILEPGESLTLTHVDCAEYDILIIDEDGDECVLTEVPLCQDDSVWKITNKELLRCVANTE